MENYKTEFLSSKVGVTVNQLAGVVLTLVLGAIKIHQPLDMEKPYSLESDELTVISTYILKSVELMFDGKNDFEEELEQCDKFMRSFIASIDRKEFREKCDEISAKLKLIKQFKK